MFIRNEYKRMLLKNIRPISSWKNRWKFIFEITRSHCRNPTQTYLVYLWHCDDFEDGKNFLHLISSNFRSIFRNYFCFSHLSELQQDGNSQPKIVKRNVIRTEGESDRQSIHLTYFWSSWEVIEFRLHVFARMLLLLCEASKEPMLLQQTVKTGTLQSSEEKICTITKRIEFRKRKWICKQMLRNIFFLHLNYTKRSQLQLRNAKEKRRNGVAHRNFIILFLIMEKISLSYLVRSIS